MAASDSSKLPEAPHPTALIVQGLKGVEEQLNNVQVVEKQVLPDAETIKKEKAELELRKSIEGVADNRKSLHHVEPQEKIVLPSSDGIIFFLQILFLYCFFTYIKNKANIIYDNLVFKFLYLSIKLDF